MAGELQLGGTTLATHTGSGASAKINLDSGLVFPAGHILQVKTAITDTLTTINTGGMQDVTGLSVDITPKLGSKLLIFIDFRFANSTSSNNGIQILRNTTEIVLGGTPFSGVERCLGNVNGVSFMDTSFKYLDEPNTDQQITYKVQVERSAGTLYINDRAILGNARYGSLVVMEIAG